MSIDLSLVNWLYARRDPLLVKIFFGITMLGKWYIAMVIVLAVAIIFYLKNHKKYIIPLFVSVGGSFLTGFLGKIIWQRPRPVEIAVYIEKSWSFPSGHAVLAVSLYGFLIYFFWKYLKKQSHKILALVFGLLIILAVGFSRLYLGVHYLSDVLAGYLVGSFWLAISIVMAELKNNNYSSTINVPVIPT
jgi:membrane-associated phospholipid phosphatase